MYTITIQYRLIEYFNFLTDVCSFEFGEKFVRAWYFKVLAYPIWFFVFYLKKVKEGECLFVFSEVGFERKSNSGVSYLKWEKIGKVVVREHFYILVGGELPSDIASLCSLGFYSLA